MLGLTGSWCLAMEGNQLKGMLRNELKRHSDDELWADRTQLDESRDDYIPRALNGDDSLDSSWIKCTTSQSRTLGDGQTRDEQLTQSWRCPSYKPARNSMDCPAFIRTHDCPCEVSRKSGLQKACRPLSPNRPAVEDFS